MKQRMSGMMPVFEGSHYVHAAACVIGKVQCGQRVSIWPNAVVRADINRIVLGESVNIQDNVVVHVTEQYGVYIGDNVTVGHGAILHACEVGAGTLIGMGAIVMDGAVVGKNCVIGAGALVPPGRHISDNNFAVGAPCRILRETTEEEMRAYWEQNANYWKLALEYIKSGDVY